ncbi:MAG: ChrR family anti-sigma-E factor [Rhodobacteraceae bacterium]|nr:ChrR family anti-sigma-E factor [Paracoccaceae bacterium]
MTDTIRHHLPDDILAAYSTGSLSEAFSLVVATHVSLCDECRATLESIDAVGGAVLEGCEAEPVAAESFEATMHRITGQAAATMDRPIQAAGLFPSALRSYVGGDVDAVRWRSVGMGVRQAILRTEPGASVRLLCIPPGAAMPNHTHRGREMTIVLQGAFRDEGGRFCRGDVEVADDHVRHAPVADAGEPCICLAATEAPLRFRDLLPRLAQPFFRI